MKWMDEKGRLWGRVNVIDLALIVIVVGALAFVGMKLLGKGEITIVSEKQEATVTIFTNAVHDFVKEQMNVGDEVRLQTNNALVGTIESLDIKQAYGLVSTADGRWVEADIPKKYAIDIVLKVNADKNGDYLSVGGVQLLAGAEVALKGPKYTVKGLVSDVR